MSRTEARLLLGSEALHLEAGPAGAGRWPFAPHDSRAAAGALAAALAQVREAGMGLARICLAGSWLRWQSQPWGAAPDAAVIAAPCAYGQPGVAVSLPAELRAALEAADGIRVVVASVPEVALAQVMKAAGRQRAVLVVMERDTLTFLRLEAGGLAAAVTVPLPAEADAAEEVATAWHRLLLRDAGFAGAVRHWLIDVDGRLAAGLSPAEFSRQALQPPGRWRAVRVLAWPWRLSPWRSWHSGVLAASLVMLALVVGGWQSARAERDVLVQQQARLLPPAAPQVARSPAEEKARALRIRQVNAAVRQLNAPVDQLLQAARPRPGSGIVLLGVQLRAGRERQLIVEGRADTMAAMAGYVRALAAQPVFSSVWLSHHEAADAEDGSGYRFRIDAGWME